MKPTLESIVTENNETSKEIKSRTEAGNRSYFALKNIYQSRIIKKFFKNKIYTMVIRPVVSYASKTCGKAGRYEKPWYFREENSEKNLWTSVGGRDVEDKK